MNLSIRTTHWVDIRPRYFYKRSTDRHFGWVEGERTVVDNEKVSEATPVTVYAFRLTNTDTTFIWVTPSERWRTFLSFKTSSLPGTFLLRLKNLLKNVVFRDSESSQFWTEQSVLGVDPWGCSVQSLTDSVLDQQYTTVT